MRLLIAALITLFFLGCAIEPNPSPYTDSTGDDGGPSEPFDQESGDSGDGADAVVGTSDTGGGTSGSTGGTATPDEDTTEPPKDVCGPNQADAQADAEKNCGN